MRLAFVVLAPLLLAMTVPWAASGVLADRPLDAVCDTPRATVAACRSVGARFVDEGDLLLAPGFVHDFVPLSSAAAVNDPASYAAIAAASGFRGGSVDWLNEWVAVFYSGPETNVYKARIESIRYDPAVDVYVVDWHPDNTGANAHSNTVDAFAVERVVPAAPVRVVFCETDGIARDACL